ncbi:hypothetical protein AOLI_G00153370 [Acnodon oligacanthus]
MGPRHMSSPPNAHGHSNLPPQPDEPHCIKASSTMQSWTSTGNSPKAEDDYEDDIPGNQNSIRLGPIYQSLDPNTSQSDSVYQGLNPNTS